MVWTPAPPRATIVSMFYGDCLNKASPMTAGERTVAFARARDTDDFTRRSLPAPIRG